MKRKSVFVSYAYAFGLTILLPAVASAATSFSNSLTGFTGNSTVPATQTAVTSAGFSFFSTAGLAEDFTSDPTVAFDANGATFGTLYGGDGGRNYMRTVQEDYATVNFTAEISFVAADMANMDVFFGLGTGDTALFGFPDWSTQFSSVLVLPEIDNALIAKLTTFKTQNDINEFVATEAPLVDGTHRLRLAFDTTAKTAIFSIDLNYAGGAFTADTTATTVDVSTLFAEDGWPTEPSRLYFGADDSAIFKDFSVVVESAPGQDGDFDGDTDVDGRDFLIWQRGGSPNSLSAGDLALWQGNYGVGGLAAVSAVPEPTTVLLLTIGAMGWSLGKRK